MRLHELALAAKNGPMLDSLRQEQAGKAAHVRVSAAVGGRPGLVTQCIDTNPFPTKNSVSSGNESDFINSSLLGNFCNCQ